MMTRTMRLAVVSTALLLAMIAAFPVAAEETGDLQITCWPGYRVYLDGQLAGLTSSDQDGLFLRGVAAGEHKVRVEKLGYQAKELQVVVPAGGIAELKVGDLLPASASPPPPAPTAPAAAPAPAAEPALVAAPRPVAEPVAKAQPGTAQPAPQAATPAPVVSQPVDEPAPAVAPQPATHLAPAPAPAAPTRDTEAEELARLIRSRDAERDVMFIYRIRGDALDGRATVSVNREKGGPRSPVLAFLCSERRECIDQTSATYAPGRYRYRVTFRSMGRGKNEVLFSHDLYLELEAETGKTYLLEIRYDGPDKQHCHAEIREVKG